MRLFLSGKFASVKTRFCFAPIFRLNSQYDQAMNNLGNLYKDMGRVTEAESLLQRAVELRSEPKKLCMNECIVSRYIQRRGTKS